MEIADTDLYLSLGSNIGDRIGYLQEAVESINEEVGELVSISSVYETPPWGFEATTSFLNLCLHMKCNLAPKIVLERIKTIEKALGREENQGKGYSSREIDIDIILYGNHFIDRGDLQIPHPRFRLRRFVLHPLNDIAADNTDPVTHLTIAQLLANCPDLSLITCYTNELQSNS